MKHCPKCGHLNEDISNFCEECGGDLAGKLSLKIRSLCWWKRQGSNRQVAIILFGLMSIVMIIIMLSYGFIYNHDTSDSSNEPFEPYGNDTGTYYTSEYLSFSHNPFKVITHSNKLENDSDLVSGKFENDDVFLIQKPVETTESAYDAAMESKNNMEEDTDIGYTSKSNLTSLQIAGVTAYKLDSLNYNKGELDTHSINYFFVKNGKLYQLTFVSYVFLKRKSTLNANKENIDKILNSIVTY